MILITSHKPVGD